MYAAPVASQTDAFWELCTEWLADAIRTGLIEKNETKRTLKFPGEGRIEARTAHTPDHLRGTYADDLYLDEYAYQDPDVWARVCQPMMLDSNGTATFISTPNLRNHFYHLYLKAIQKDDWEVFTFSSLDNPHLSPEALATMTADMTDVDYRQEILAEFVPGVGAVFTIRPTDFYKPPVIDEIPVVHEGHRLVGGLDWGRKKDFTVLSVGCATCEKEVWLERTNLIDYPSQCKIIKKTLGRIAPNGRPVELLAEENSIGLPNIDQLRLDGVPVNGFFMSNTSKGSIVQELRLCFAQEEWKWVKDLIAWRELESYEMNISLSGLATYNAPEGLHDDTVVARMMMHHQALTGMLQVY